MPGLNTASIDDRPFEPCLEDDLPLLDPPENILASHAFSLACRFSALGGGSMILTGDDAVALRCLSERMGDPDVRTALPLAREPLLLLPTSMIVQDSRAVETEMSAGRCHDWRKVDSTAMRRQRINSNSVSNQH